MSDAVARSGYGDGEHFWECVVSDGEQWHFIRVPGVELGRFPRSGERGRRAGVERFAAKLPESYRLDALLAANPLHVDRDGTVTD